MGKPQSLRLAEIKQRNGSNFDEYAGCDVAGQLDFRSFEVYNGFIGSEGANLTRPDL